MSKGKTLSDFEKGKILAYYENINNYSEIARKIGRSPDVVSNYLKNSNSYGNNTRPGRPAILSEKFVKKIQQMSSNTTLSVQNINDKLNTGVSNSTVLRAIHLNKNIIYKK